MTGHLIISYVPTTTLPAIWIVKKEGTRRHRLEKEEQRKKDEIFTGGADEESQLQRAIEKSIIEVRKD